jgi:hypothetical protein
MCVWSRAGRRDESEAGPETLVEADYKPPQLVTDLLRLALFPLGGGRGGWRIVRRMESLSSHGLW